MTETVSATEPMIRMGFFVGILVAMTVWEILAPRRDKDGFRAIRRMNNLGIVVLNTVLARLILPATAGGLALVAEAEGWGLFNLVSVPEWAAVLISVMLLDLAIYLQHVMFHAVPALWRLHRMHHADTGFDVTTGLRFHPLEILLSAVFKLALVLALGPPALAVLIFEVALNGTAMFNHSNARIPVSVDRVLRLFVVTPDMHRVHHSVHRDETDANFGFNLPWWDRLLGTYIPQPRDGHDNMTIGLPMFRDPGENRLDKLVTQPWRRG